MHTRSTFDDPSLDTAAGEDQIKRPFAPGCPASCLCPFLELDDVLLAARGALGACDLDSPAHPQLAVPLLMASLAVLFQRPTRADEHPLPLVVEVGAVVDV